MEKLKIAGQISLNKQIDDSGGMFTTQEVATLLGIYPGAVIKQFERGHLLALPFGESIGYPTWQFDENGVVAHFADIITLLNTSSPVGIFRFFLTFDEDLKCTPIEVLKGEDLNQLEMVKILAKQFNQQVAR